MSIIKTDKLTKYYGRARGIIDVDLDISEGDMFGFIGPNGAGKSTTIRTLLGLISPSAGSAEIFGLDISKDRSKILSDIGYLPSEVAFYHSMKVRDVLSLSADLRGKNCTEESKVLCERLELDMGKRVNELSFGNKKKVGIVCALQHKPKLYILDEPTSGLDPLMQREFYSILEERNKEGATVFLSSHILSEVDRYCKRAAIIRDGKIAVTGEIDRLSYTGIKRVTVKGGKKLPSDINIKDIKAEGEVVSFLFSGEPGKLISLISEIQPSDFTVADPDLEEVFMHFYEREGK